MGEAAVVTGMVLSAMPIGDYDKRLVILTREKGKITAFAKGARRQNSPYIAGSRPFSFGEFSLYEGRSTYTIAGMHITNYFDELATDMSGAFYGFYFLEFADYYGRENVDETQMLKLLYQSLRALGKESISNKLIRYIFELKAMVINGEYPEMFQCIRCGKNEMLQFITVRQAGVVCEHCKSSVPDALHVSTSAIYTLQFIIASPIEKLFTFIVSEEVLDELADFMHRYLAHYLDKKFKSLDILEKLY